MIGSRIEDSSTDDNEVLNSTVMRDDNDLNDNNEEIDVNIEDIFTVTIDEEVKCKKNM